MKATLKRFILSLLFYSTSAFGVSLTIQANVGVSAFNSMNVSIAAASNIKVGTITILLNLTFTLVYMILSKFKYPIKYLVQVSFLMLFGSLINFYVYTLFQNWVITSYWMQLLLLCVGVIIGGLSVGMVIHYNVITFPIESVCVQLEERTGRRFAFYRYGVDVFSVFISLIITMMFHLPFFAREGTLISMFLLTTAMNFSKQKMSARMQTEQ